MAGEIESSWGGMAGAGTRGVSVPLVGAAARVSRRAALGRLPGDSQFGGGAGEGTSSVS